MRLHLRAALLAGVCCFAGTAAHAAVIDFLDNIDVAGDAADASGDAPGVNGDRLSFGSDLFFDGTDFWGLADRGPGGGFLDYETRLHKLAVDFDTTTGQILGVTATQTIKFKDANGNPFNGQNPLLLNGNAGTLGNSFDPEGLVVLQNGHFLVSDEYGPSIYEFDGGGTFLRSIKIPGNLTPIDANGDVNFMADRTSSPALADGRQDNRGFEGITLTPDGTKLYAVLQDPLIDEGPSNQGRRGQNTRIVEFDLTAGDDLATADVLETNTRQFVYQLEALADINDRIPGTANDFAATSQGRNIGLSAILALGDNQFLVLERDNRGEGVDPSTAVLPVGSKRVFKMDITLADDVSAINLTGTNDLSTFGVGGVTPVAKELFLDIQAFLVSEGLIVPEKIEGLAFGPNLANGRKTIFLATDNDFSVTQDPAQGNAQSNVCLGDGAFLTDVALDEACPDGTSLIPSRVFVFSVPEPSLAAAFAGGLGLLGWVRRTRRG